MSLSEINKGLQDAVAELTDDREIVSYMLIVVDEDGQQHWASEGSTLEVLGAMELVKAELIASENALAAEDAAADEDDEDDEDDAS